MYDTPITGIIAGQAVRALHTSALPSAPTMLEQRRAPAHQRGARVRLAAALRRTADALAPAVERFA